MKLNRKNMTAGIAGLGLVGALATGGVAAAQASTGGGAISQPPSTTSSSVGDHRSGHMAGMAFGQSSPMVAVASYLGLSQTELHDRLQSGGSLADVAEAQGKSVSGLKDAMVSQQRTTFDSNSTLSSDDREAAVEQMKSRIDLMLNATHTPGEGMGMGSGVGMHSGAGNGDDLTVS
ncbi:hypothetical protein E3O53_03910 [Cryobacterium sp. TMT2-18-3]|uniref:hypothetical protein n=1 Tax=unclassified Cryobacterium TaxID=2649013 RepID=UPI001069C3DE|nr:MULTISPECIES: hypothetical protein [unclassified Cryobacterium]TFC29033.1 hypothetical protein E3O22_07785 [Cryobacterium sp. TMT2-18-2]TFC38519.1 hypothetical protein E3O18_02875 [Cryobacterium sp. TMT2-42-4]TFC66327.1 hypothetical protein E3O53_03910 [Cryobacterium sp. TMT2-18-3]